LAILPGWRWCSAGNYNPAQTPQYGKILDVHLDDGDFVFEVLRPAQ
jgi:hypothetical protein